MQTLSQFDIGFKNNKEILHHNIHSALQFIQNEKKKIIKIIQILLFLIQ